jgi:DMSO/TMAO reductase YedYZ molybdopterin-dependent catalytic subunit
MGASDGDDGGRGSDDWSDGIPEGDGRATDQAGSEGLTPPKAKAEAATADPSVPPAATGHDLPALVKEQTADGEPPEDRTSTGVISDDSFGFPERLWRTVAEHRPPGIPTSKVWRSPLRGPWLTSVFGFLLLISLPLVIVTGLLDYIAYGPQFHQAIPAHVGFLHLPYFDWPNRPAWLFQLTEGMHVGLGLVLVPVVLAKLWSVMPKLFAWPPVRSAANLLERLSLIMIVGGIVFEMVTGILNIQYDYIFGFSFYTAHYFGAWVFIAGFVVHVSLKLPTMVRSLRSRSLVAELRTPLAKTRPEPTDPDGLVALSPSKPTISRRGALAVVGGGSLMIAVLTVGQTLGGVTRKAALLLPRGQ